MRNLSLTKRRTRSAYEEGTQLKSLIRGSCLESFKRSFLGRIPAIWKKMPCNMRNEGQRTSWTKVKKRAKLFLTGRLKELQQTEHTFYREQQQQLLPDTVYLYE